MNTDTDYVFVKGENGGYEPVDVENMGESSAESSNESSNENSNESSNESSKPVAESEENPDTDSQNNQPKGNGLVYALIAAGVVLVAIIVFFTAKFYRKG